MNHQSILTCGVDFKVQAFDWEGKVVKLQIWDTAGQERFRAIVSSYYRNTSGILLCYDITDPTTAENVKNWLSEIEKHAPEDIPIVLCGTKADLQSNHFQSENIRLSSEIIKDVLASYPEIKHHCITSAKTGEGVEDAFLKLVDVMLKHEANAKRVRESQNLDNLFIKPRVSEKLSWSNTFSSLLSGSCSI
jgi:small GTP-binding protein